MNFSTARGCSEGTVGSRRVEARREPQTLAHRLETFFVSAARCAMVNQSFSYAAPPEGKHGESDGAPRNSRTRLSLLSGRCAARVRRSARLSGDLSGRASRITPRAPEGHPQVRSVTSQQAEIRVAALVLRNSLEDGSR